MAWDIRQNRTVILNIYIILLYSLAGLEPATFPGPTVRRGRSTVKLQWVRSLSKATTITSTISQCYWMVTRVLFCQSLNDVFNTENGTWTRMSWCSQHFKCCVSANSTTPANKKFKLLNNICLLFRIKSCKSTITW